ncbi:MAG: phosphatidate cytidylyltransferase [Spirochaetota bacterium]|nr:phosphatidate cytidylyltransferase [Spirochaetota bacterium]
MNDVNRVTITRILSAAIALPVYVFAFISDYLHSIPVLIVSMIISIISLYEFYHMCVRSNDEKPFIFIGLFTGAIVNIVMYYFAYGELYQSINSQVFDARIIFAIIIFLIATILILQLCRRPIKGGIYSLSVTVFGVMYIGFFFSHIILMKALQDGFFYILILNIVVMLNDTGAYFGGILLGKHKTNFAVSPNKTWEGYASGMLISILSMIITNEIFMAFYNKYLFTLIESVVLGIFLSIFGHMGDLVESLIKRDSVRKDSGSIIPGHGGMWDAFDALIFTFPFFYYYIVLKGV